MLKELEQDGVVVKSACGVKAIRASLLCTVFDLVAETPAFNTKQFNGYYGCYVCAHPVVYSGRCITYPPGAYPLRTHASVLAGAQKGIDLYAHTCTYTQLSYGHKFEVL